MSRARGLSQELWDRDSRGNASEVAWTSARTTRIASGRPEVHDWCRLYETRAAGACTKGSWRRRRRRRRRETTMATEGVGSRSHGRAFYLHPIAWNPEKTHHLTVVFCTKRIWLGKTPPPFIRDEGASSVSQSLSVIPRRVRESWRTSATNSELFDKRGFFVHEYSNFYLSGINIFQTRTKNIYVQNISEIYFFLYTKYIRENIFCVHLRIRQNIFFPLFYDEKFYISQYIFFSMRGITQKFTQICHFCIFREIFHIEKKNQETSEKWWRKY